MKTNRVIASQLDPILSRTIPARLSMRIVGSPGCGKSAIFAQVCAKLSIDFLPLYPATMTPERLEGYPTPVAGKIVHTLDELLDSIFSTTVETHVLLEEISKAPRAVQSACAPLLHDRRIGRWTLPDCVAVSMTANQLDDAAGDAPLLSHLLSRIASTLILDPDAASFLAYAERQKWARPEVLSFLRSRPAAISDFDAERAMNDDSYACPRSWENLCRLLPLDFDDGSTLLPVIVGAIGERAGHDFFAHLKLVRESIDILAMLAEEPGEKIKIPGKLGAKWALAYGLGGATNKKNYPRALDVITQLAADSETVVFSDLALKQSLIAFPALAGLPEFSDFAGSAVGQRLVRVRSAK